MGYRVERFGLFRGNSEGMVGALDDVQGRALAEVGDDRFQQVDLGQRVSRARHKQHGYLNPRKMIRALGARLSGRMQREAEEG